MSTEMDAQGWAQIHHAALAGYILSVEKYIEEDPELLEYETTDDLNSTPFLLAVTGGKLECVQFLIKKGAKINAQNSKGQGAVEISLLNNDKAILQYFIDTKFPELPVWKKLFQCLLSDIIKEAVKAAECLEMLTEPYEESTEGVNPNWNCLLHEGGISALIKLLRGNIYPSVQSPIVRSLLNMVQCEQTARDMVKKGVLVTLAKLLKSSDREVLKATTMLLMELANVPEHADAEIEENIPAILVDVLTRQTNTDVLVTSLQVLSNIAASKPENQAAVVNTENLFASVINLFKLYYSSKSLSNDLTNAVQSFVKSNPAAQYAFIEKGICVPLTMILTKVRVRELQLNAVDTIHYLAINNPQTQKILLNEQLDKYLMHLFSRGRSEKLQEKTASSLWAIAGTDVYIQRMMATRMGVPLLLSFIKSMTENLHYIGSEALSVLAQGPISYRNEIAPQGTLTLVQLLRTQREDIVLSATRTLRHLCVATGFVAYHNNQQLITQTNGAKQLTALMANSKNLYIKVEAALTLAYISLGNLTTMETVKRCTNFSYSLIMNLLHCGDKKAQLTAGMALATFAYNSTSQQREMAELGGVRLSWFRAFLESDDEYFRCSSAFQIVILARIITDEDKAITSAMGIRILIDLLENSVNDAILTLAADCVARLTHTRSDVGKSLFSSKSCKPTHRIGSFRKVSWKIGNITRNWGFPQFS
ncbi:ankyrin and armadillo repeat-containing protein-like isoform X3 [Octopus sinensis]|uniref:Ankyrin and armadillo repeat-containing protein-like isoform X3 n=1 Tax=Octopus sinensis TaxID=2607531 RepID=A0A7E6FT22_9MOLL|nr:ankyrin and armadillo repeat-containing protein-like isoform X3 [Octopus sinensis]